MRRTIFYKVALFLFLSLFLSLLLMACGSPSGGGAADEKVPVTLRFRLPGAAAGASLKIISAPAAVASIQMTVRGPGMDTISETFSISPGEIVSQTFQVLPGSGRIFGGTIFDATNLGLFEGETGPVEILPGSTPKITLVLKALFEDEDTPPPPVLNLFSELPRFSSNYILNDTPGTAPFLGISTSNSGNYSVGVGVVAVTGEKSESTNYILR